jgi:hypothetical protein
VSTTTEKAIVRLGGTQTSGRTRVRVGRVDSSSHWGAPIVAVPRSQLYYWSPEWRKLESEALAELRSGEARRFETAADAIRWLLSEDD